MTTALRLLRSALAALGVTLVGACAHLPATSAVAPQRLDFEQGLLITGDLALEKLNDEELFAAGQTSFAAAEHAEAARYFGRIADFWPNSPHHFQATYNAGLALLKLKRADEAQTRFEAIADAARGLGESLDAAFKLADAYYFGGKPAQAAEVLRTIADRPEVGPNKRLEARVSQGICEVEAGQLEVGEVTLRAALTYYGMLPDKELVEDDFPAKAQFFLGEIYRVHYENVQLDGNKPTDKLAEDLEYKSQLLLSAQGHYLRTIRLGNGYWATASGQRVGGLYESMYDHMLNAPAPAELSPVERAIYREELRRKVRILITKAISIYERTLETAQRIGTTSDFVEQARASLKRMKDLLLAEAHADDERG